MHALKPASPALLVSVSVIFMMFVFFLSIFMDEQYLLVRKKSHK